MKFASDTPEYDYNSNIFYIITLSLFNLSLKYKIIVVKSNNLYNNSVKERVVISENALSFCFAAQGYQ